MELVDYVIANSSTFMFVLIRTSAVLLASPIFGAFNIPMQVKAGLAAFIALVLTPLVGVVPMPQDILSLSVCIGGEILVGAAIGFCIRFIFTGIEFAGQVASFQMGIGMASAYDPMSSAQVTVLGRFLSILTLLLFLSLNGHLMILMALAKSFEIIPPYGFHVSGALMENMIVFSKQVFILAAKFSAPVIAVLIFVNLALGILARVVPQLNMFAVGFIVTIPAGFIIIGLSLPVFETALSGVFDSMWESVYVLMRSING